MANRNNFYKITETNGIWTATHGQQVLFEKAVDDLQQFGLALIAKNADKFHLYIPSKFQERTCFSVSSITTEYYYKPCLFVSSFENFEVLHIGYDEETVIFIRDSDYCTAIKPDSFSWYLSKKGILSGRLNNLNKKFGKNISFKGYFHNNALIFTIDGKDYLFHFMNFCVYEDAAQMEILYLGNAEFIRNSEVILVKNEIGQYIHTGCDIHYRNPKYFDNIVPFKPEDYPDNFILSESNSKGFWYMTNEEIFGFYMLFLEPAKYSFGIDLIVDKPISSIQLQKDQRSISPLGKYEISVTDYWKLIYTDGSVENKKTTYHCIQK